ncbi:MAG: hypothetical protein K2P78_08010 [Gemmataceae bacterium]|nr:hypothetical protein [Gemmataceae bacterium]
MSERTGLMKLGETFFGGAPTNSTDGAHILGREIVVKDRIRGWERERRMRAVRNSTGAAVLPKRLAVLSADGRSISRYARLANEKGLPIDEQLPAAGCAANDICFVVVRGPALCLTDLANYGADIAAGDYLNAQTATTGGTTAGRVKVRTLTSSVTAAVTEQDGVFGRAISAVSTNSTNNDILVDINPF